MKINITVADELLNWLDEYADNNFMSRSGLISLACNQFKTQNEVLTAVKNISNAMKKIADTGAISEEQIKEMEELHNFCKMITGE